MQQRKVRLFVFQRAAIYHRSAPGYPYLFTGSRFVSTMLNAIALILHLIAINIWVGGSFFAIVILGRAIKSIDSAQQHTLWLQVFNRFFAWAWLAVFILLTSGTWMVYSVYGGFKTIPVYVALMGLLAMLMVANFVFIYFVPYRQYQQLVRFQHFNACIQKLAVIRVVGIVNMILGAGIVVVIGSRMYLL